MNLKNYTSQSPAQSSIAKIERVLMELGANRILKDIDKEKKVVSAIMFEVTLNGNPLYFRLPAKVDSCFKIFWTEVKRPQPTTRKAKMEQAERTAWKIILDWVEAQAALIRLEQADFAEIFLPYVYDPASGKTLYEIASNKDVSLSIKKLLS